VYKRQDFKDLQTFDAELAQKLLDAQSDFLEDFLEQIRIRLEMRSVRNYNIPIRITNLEYKCLLREISNEKIGRLVAVDGIVTQVSVAELIIIKAQYRCLTCNDVQTINQNSQYTIYPKKCLSSDCTDGRGFEIVPEASTFKRVQHIVIQELPDQVPPGKIPAKLKADLEEDLVEAVKPGERVTLIGVLSGKTRKKGDTHPIVVPYLLINNVISEREDTALDISDEDVEDFKKMVSENDHLDKITRSIAPTIYGNPEVKQAIALQQCEGVTKEIHGNRKRGQSHILLAGDASQGKSELIDFAVRLHPRGIKTTGKGATAAGLTAAVVKDEELSLIHI